MISPVLPNEIARSFSFSKPTYPYVTLFLWYIILCILNLLNLWYYLVFWCVVGLWEGFCTIVFPNCVVQGKDPRHMCTHTCMFGVGRGVN